MLTLDISRAFSVNKVLRSSFDECRLCLRDVERAGREVVISPSLTQKEFMIKAGSLPPEMYMPHRNFFSALFQAVYGFLDIPQERRMLYGRINYLFRIWVTSADNLLDGEDKVSFSVKMPVDSRVMRQVVVIMAADRILARFLDDAVTAGVISRDEARLVSDGTLQVLLPSAAEEASEEGGIKKRPAPEYVLNTIHQLKTGLLFHLPLFGPERIEKNADRKVLADCREGLGKFGLGCQLLDDMRDLARDHLEKRQNYALSLMVYQHPSAFKRLNGMENTLKVDDPIFLKFSDELRPVARMGYEHMLDGLQHLNRCGLGLKDEYAQAIVHWMFKALDVEKSLRWLA
ncbi:MAG: hypothetical protein HQL17_06550 [Candidatus Omnitrophica bacterium]|nr:hypothetical protein [Candidatus Omnitrophota bacterium]